MEREQGKSLPDPLEERTIDVTASMQGTISFSDPVNLRIQGSFEGKLQAKGQLTVGEKAHVKAEVEADRVTIAGKVEGKVMARELLQVTSTGQCIGEITTSRLIVEEGGILQGECRVSKGMETPAVLVMPTEEGTAAAQEVSGAAPVLQEVRQGQERRQWPRLDLSERKGKGVLVRVTLESGEPINGYARNISAGGVFMELPIEGELPQEFPLRIFFPGRTRPIKTTGKLVWSRKGLRPSLQRVAAKFSDVSPAHQKPIQRFIANSGMGVKELPLPQEKVGA